jgi:hypothetical protein
LAVGDQRYTVESFFIPNTFVETLEIEILESDEENEEDDYEDDFSNYISLHPIPEGEIDLCLNDLLSMVKKFCKMFRSPTRNNEALQKCMSYNMKEIHGPNDRIKYQMELILYMLQKFLSIQIPIKKALIDLGEFDKFPSEEEIAVISDVVNALETVEYGLLKLFLWLQYQYGGWLISVMNLCLINLRFSLSLNLSLKLNLENRINECRNENVGLLRLMEKWKKGKNDLVQFA